MYRSGLIMADDDDKERGDEGNCEGVVDERKSNE